MNQNALPRVALDRLKEAKPGELAARFALGGAITVGAGLIANRFGPEIGGLFLAFPSILPASLTLLEKHDGDQVAGTDALGATFGGGGLIAFALVVWVLADRAPMTLVLSLALLAWMVISWSLWRVMEPLFRHDDQQSRDMG